MSESCKLTGIVISISEVLMFENYDLDSVFTPVDYNELYNILTEVNYDRDKIDYLVTGFKEGFSLHYEGDEKVKIKSNNLRFNVGDEIELWNKVMKEVQSKRYAGPFKEIPFEFYIQSPIGLVPKDNGQATHLIFHLSHPRVGMTLVNYNTPKQKCTVTYPEFSKAIQMCIREGVNCKCDWKSAFRHFLILNKYWKFLTMKAKNPVNNEWYYFIDKCMPFGSSVSCAHFQAFLDAIAFVMWKKTEKEVINYLDDFLFIALMAWFCNHQVEVFLKVCSQIKFPVSLEKTFWVSPIIVFLGMLIDNEKQRISIPQSKIEKALKQIHGIINSKKRKTMVTQIQKLCGLLNFFCRAILPGRAFTTRIYANLTGVNAKLKPHHHIKVGAETILDLQVWETFLGSPMAYSRPFLDLDNCVHAEELDWFSDAAKSVKKGYGGHHMSHWFYGQWDANFIKDCDPSIEFLKLYALVIGVLLWTKYHQNSRITLFCDNESVVFMVNNQSSKCRNCMIFIRIITMHCMSHNTRVYAKHVRTHLNKRADDLSRLKVSAFKETCQNMGLDIDPYPSVIPEVLCDIKSLWIH